MKVSEILLRDAINGANGSPTRYFAAAEGYELAADAVGVTIGHASWPDLCVQPWGSIQSARSAKGDAEPKRGPGRPRKVEPPGE